MLRITRQLSLLCTDWLAKLFGHQPRPLTPFALPVRQASTADDGYTWIGVDYDGRRYSILAPPGQYDGEPQVLAMPVFAGHDQTHPKRFEFVGSAPES